jgi:two-component sensor histidine kinase
VEESLLSSFRHRVVNDMSLIHALLGMAMRRTSDAQASRLFRSSRSRVRAVASFHSMPWLDDDDSRAVDAGAYFKEVVHEIERQWATHGRVRVELATDGVRLGLAEVVPVGLCLNELVRNAIEHGFPDERSGVVRASLTAEGDDLLLRVADDGVGFSPGADEATSGLGLSLVRLLAEQLSAVLELTSSANHGTECCLRFRTTKESSAWQTS